MPFDDVGDVLFDSATEVLETMFFMSPIGATTNEGGIESWVSAQLNFHGEPSGKFGVRVPLQTGRRMAAAFLGLDEAAPSEAQIQEVVCELANMVCGSALSRLEENTRFDLSSPELRPAPAGCPHGGRFLSRGLELEEGPLSVWLQVCENQPV